LIFFFFITIVNDWHMKPILLILICILNDAATLVIAVDNAKISAHPDKWRIGQLIFLSVVLGVLLTGLSYAHYYTAKHFESTGEFDKEGHQLEAVMYLHISSAPHFVIFSTRLSGYFWENMPSPIFFIAVMGTQVFAMLICVYGVIVGKAIGWTWGICVILVSLFYFIILDFVKVYIFRNWSFEFTAHAWPSKERRDKLAARKQRVIQQKRVWSSIDKVREVGLKMKVLEALKA
jgi:H+-transporting ATPase